MRKGRECGDGGKRKKRREWMDAVTGNSWGREWVTINSNVVYGGV